MFINFCVVCYFVLHVCYVFFILFMSVFVYLFFFFSSRRRHTRCALVTGVQTCALPISIVVSRAVKQMIAPVRDQFAARRCAKADRIGHAVIPHRDAVVRNARWHIENIAGFENPFIGGFKTCEQRSEAHTSELQSLMRISYAVFCLKKKKQDKQYSCRSYTL